MSVKTYDTHSYELAEFFLEADPFWPNVSTEKQKQMLNSLAIDIQTAVEDWFEENRLPG